MTPREPRWVVLLKALLLASAALLYLWPMATRPGLIAGLASLMVGVGVARLLEPKRLRTWAGGAIAVFVGLGAFPLGGALLNSTSAGQALDGRSLLVLADGLQWGLAAFAVGFGLRFLAARARPLAVLEAAFVVGSVAYTFARHRDHMIARPRFFADWAWSMGYDPTVILMALGVAVAAVATLLLLRHQRPAKLAVTAVMLLLLGLVVYQLMGFVPVEVDPFTNGLGLTDDNPGQGDGDGDGEGGGGKGDGDGKGGGGKSDNDSKSNSNSSGGGAGGGSPPPPVPVAVAIFNDDYDPPGGIYYFRQQVLSRFDGTKLVADDSGRFDQDVITEFPEAGPIQATKGAPNPDFHTRVPTTMFLLHDHPQPVGLSQSIQVEPHDNPAPRRFVAAYSVVSQTLSTGLDRFLGRASVDPMWTPERREHYLAYPDDPRYVTLAAEILHKGLDPRFVGDDVAKALVIKAWLEKNGFYTRKERHAGVPDPAGHFLFGSLRGYCVHFAHSFAHLMRSQGIAARVALGYAVDTRLRGSGSAVLIMGDRAHAWPEIHIEGVGWIPFDIYPERSDEEPAGFVDQSLENLLGELARNDPSGGRNADPDKALEIPWAGIGRGALALLVLLLTLLYAVKIARRLWPRLSPGQRAIFVAVLDQLADLGHVRQRGETRERYAARLAALTPSLNELTMLHLRAALGGRDAGPAAAQAVAAKIDQEIASAVPRWRRALAVLNPVGWWFAR